MPPPLATHYSERIARLAKAVPAAAALIAACAAQQVPAQTLHPSANRTITLAMPAGLQANVALRGLQRPRFLAVAPDGRLFVTTMYNLADNTRGTVAVLEGWDPATHTFTRAVPYLTHLRNPNNLVFWTDPDTRQTWLYVALTDRLLRYRYTAGEAHPATPPETLLRFPDYGLNYKYGGWHLTRTVALATLHGHTLLYVSAGSSCNYCRELEAERASVIAMEPDGQHPRIVAHGMRNAVDLRSLPDIDGGALFATNMGDDHLGDALPEDTVFELDSNHHPGPIAGNERQGFAAPNYGWPTCYFAHGKPVHDATPLPTNPGPGDKQVAEHPAPSADSVYGLYAGSTHNHTVAAGTNLAARPVADQRLPDLGPVPAPLADCDHVPAAYTTFAAHSSPLGMVHFGAKDPILHGSFLVALHGASHTHIGTGYRVVKFTATDHAPRDFAMGFLTHDPSGKSVVHGRPCGLLRVGPDQFLLTDDLNGAIYFVGPAPQAH